MKIDYVIPDSGFYVDNVPAEFAAANTVKDGANVIFIYFRGEKNKLYRASSKTTDGKFSFSKPQSITEGPTLVKNASLSVVPDLERESNVIYAMKFGSKGFNAFDDKWA
jgi:hypothetical protein